MTRTTPRAASRLAVLAAAAALALPAAAHPMGEGADACGPRAGMGFAAFDADGDGRITREELRAVRAAAVEGLDADGDGFITAEELAAHRLRQAEARIAAQAACIVARLDLDGDGRLGAAELAAGVGMGAGPGGGMMPERMFDRLDTDTDGAVTEAEFAAARQRMRDMHGAGPRGRMDRSERPGRRGHDHGEARQSERRPEGGHEGRRWMRP